MGEHIINFIFFYKIKDYIELNNIIIHYYCWEQYHKNVSDFNCSKNIILFDYQEVGFELWQGRITGSYVGDLLTKYWLPNMLKTI